MRTSEIPSQDYCRSRIPIVDLWRWRSKCLIPTWTYPRLAFAWKSKRDGPSLGRYRKNSPNYKKTREQQKDHHQTIKTEILSQGLLKDQRTTRRPPNLQNMAKKKLGSSTRREDSPRREVSPNHENAAISQGLLKEQQEDHLTYRSWQNSGC